MDNLAAHKVKGVCKAIEACGAEAWYLPSYSPDLAPGRADVVEGQGVDPEGQGPRG